MEKKTRDFNLFAMAGWEFSKFSNENMLFILFIIVKLNDMTLWRGLDHSKHSVGA